MEEAEIIAIEKEIEDIYYAIKKLAVTDSTWECFRKFDANYQKMKKDGKTTLVFCGKYSTGKSTIMRALTGDDSFDVGVGETTSEVREYSWGDGLVLVDTPGIFTDTVSNEQKARKAMEEADMIAYCVSENLFDQGKNERNYFMKLAQRYQNKLVLCITKCPRTSPKRYLNIQNDIDTAIGDAIVELNLCIFDAKDYIDGNKYEDKGQISTSNFQAFIDFLNTISEQDKYNAKCNNRLRQMQSCLDDMMKVIPSSLDSDLSEKEAVELQRIEEIRRRANITIRQPLYEFEINMLEKIQKNMHEKGASEFLSEERNKAFNELNQVVSDVEDNISQILRELGTNVDIDDSIMEEMHINDSNIPEDKSTTGGGQFLKQNINNIGKAAVASTNIVAEMAQEVVGKRGFFQRIFNRTPAAGTEGTKLFSIINNKMPKGEKLAPKLAPKLGKAAVNLSEFGGAFDLFGGTLQCILDETNEKKQQLLIRNAFMDFNGKLKSIINSVIDKLKKTVDRNCQDARDSVHERFEIKLGHNTPEDQMRHVIQELQKRINHLQDDIENGGKA
jgi:GTP-binding protein EngB required for normal cell division